MKYDYTVYGSPTCGQCKVAKMLLTKKNIKFMYEDITALDDATQEVIFALARKAGKGSLPIVIDESTGEVVDWRKI